MISHMKRTKIVSFLILVIMSFGIVSTPLYASSKDIPLYYSLEDSHIWSDELTRYALTSVSRIIALYEIGMNTGEISLIKQIPSLFDDVLKALELVASIPRCSSILKMAYTEVKSYVDKCLEDVNYILSNITVTNARSTASYVAVLTKIDALSDMIINELNPSLIAAEVDIMKLAIISQNVRMVQNANSKALYMNSGNTSSSKVILDTLVKEYKTDYEDSVLPGMTKTISKATDAVDKAKKEKVLALMSTIYIRAAEIQAMSESLKFDSKPVISVTNNFIANANKVDSLLFELYLHAEFT